MSNFLLNFLNNLPPPAACLLCGDNSNRAALCTNCRQELPWLPAQHCPNCALPTLDGGPCGKCLKSAPAFDFTIAAFLYRDSLSQLIPAAKFGARWSLLPALAGFLAEKVEALEHPDLLVPLPLHPQRLKERGFNQALEIAEPLAKRLKVPLENTLLQRVRNTEHQARLSEKARHRNMRRAFLATRRLDGLHIALIDDVLTTGASLDAAAHALKLAGASRVDAWVLARTP